MFIIEIGHEAAMPCRPNGSRISPKSELGRDLMDCNRSGDCEPACRYVIEHHKPQFRIVKMVDGKYENVIATHADKAKVCREIYFDSDSDFEGDESLCETYLVWEAATDIERQEYASR